MNIENDFIRDIYEKDWFGEDGAYVIFDGQYGSTGKGLLSAYLTKAVSTILTHDSQHVDPEFAPKLTVTTNAGPNSGHTSFIGPKEVVLRQLPTMSVHLNAMEHQHICYLNGGAIIDRNILPKEIREYYDEMLPKRYARLVVHPFAAVVPNEYEDEASQIASTNKGVMSALIAKMRREPYSDATYGELPCSQIRDDGCRRLTASDLGRTIVEVAQGYSLGINSGFYPYTTSRECTVSQALADLGVSPRFLRKSIACLRLYPIRVGNTADGYSGPGYDDQKEVSFELLGQKPEYTTVTGRKRRIFTFSMDQFTDMLEANAPDALFLNFLNYAQSPDAIHAFIDDVVSRYAKVMDKEPDFVLLGYGPHVHQIREHWL